MSMNKLKIYTNETTTKIKGWDAYSSGRGPMSQNNSAAQTKTLKKLFINGCKHFNFSFKYFGCIF